jgi:hypothetical protein
MKVEKVHLKTFISTLVGLYNKGVDYVDIQRNEDEEGNPSLMIYFSEDYMDKDLLSRNNDDNDFKDLI